MGRYLLEVSGQPTDLPFSLILEEARGRLLRIFDGERPLEVDVAGPVHMQ